MIAAFKAFKRAGWERMEARRSWGSVFGFIYHRELQEHIGITPGRFEIQSTSKKGGAGHGRLLKGQWETQPGRGCRHQRRKRRGKEEFLKSSVSEFINVEGGGNMENETFFTICYRLAPANPTFMFGA